MTLCSIYQGKIYNKDVLKKRLKNRRSCANDSAGGNGKDKYRNKLNIYGYKTLSLLKCLKEKAINALLKL